MEMFGMVLIKFKKLKKMMTTFLGIVFLPSSIALASGSISGGGGGTVPSKPVKKETIIQILDRARPVLHVYFNGLSFRMRNQPENADIYEKLFGSGYKVFDALKYFKMEYRLDSLCPTSDGSWTDGSTPWLQGGLSGVCISVKSLTEKLSGEAAVPQVLGLVAHEYGHLSSLDESQAQRLQEQVVEDFSMTSLAEAESVIVQSRDLFAKLLTIPVYGEPCKDLVQSCQEAESAAGLLSKMDLDHYGKKIFFSLFYEEYSEFVTEMLRFDVIKNGLCTLGGPEFGLSNKHYSKDVLMRTFKGSRYISLADFLDNRPVYDLSQLGKNFELEVHTPYMNPMGDDGQIDYTVIQFEKANLARWANGLWAKYFALVYGAEYKNN
jgi:hypothetical protein